MSGLINNTRQNEKKSGIRISSSASFRGDLKPRDKSCPQVNLAASRCKIVGPGYASAAEETRLLFAQEINFSPDAPAF